MKGDSLLRPAGGIHKKQAKKFGTGFSGIEFKRSKGQHILRNPMVVTAIVDKAGLKSTDTVLEIGPGTGNLTVKLLEKARKVEALEVDPDMVLELNRRVQDTPHANKLNILQGSILRIPLPYFDICVSNIPYNLTSSIIFKLLAHRPAPRAIILMIQREVAQRVVAAPGDPIYSRLSVNVQLLARCYHLLKVGKNNFRPPPKVESSVIRLEPRYPPPPVSFKEWDALIRMLFNQKGRTLQKILTNKKLLKVLQKNAERISVLQDIKDISKNNQQSAEKIMEQNIEELIASMTLEDSEAVDILGNKPGTIKDDDDAEDMQEDEQDENISMQVVDRQKESTQQIQNKIIKVIQSLDLEYARPRKMGQQDFMSLLAGLNEAGIHLR